jgi:hypothetical protein
MGGGEGKRVSKRWSHARTIAIDSRKINSSGGGWIGWIGWLEPKGLLCCGERPRSQRAHVRGETGGEECNEGSGIDGETAMLARQGEPGARMTREGSERVAAGREWRS